MNELSAAAVRSYHERTKHHPGGPGRRIDPTLIPRDHKSYVDLPVVPLPGPAVSSRTLFEVLAGTGTEARHLSLGALAAVLHYSAGIVRRRRIGGREFAFRAAPCTGAAYHVELYVVCGDVGPLPAGAYHYDVPSASLRELRRGDYRRALAGACCDDGVAAADASLVLTSTFWRNGWRYGERAYRHVFWDAGTLLANLLALAEAHSLAPVLRSTFVDGEVNALLGVDPRREAAVAVVSLGAGTVAPQSPAVTTLDVATEPLSRAEVEYPLIWQTHAATSLRDCDEVRTWRERSSGARKGASKALVPQVALALEASIERRGSSRRYSDTPLSLEETRSVLSAARGSRHSDHPAEAALCTPLLVVNRVEGVSPGAYALDEPGELTPLREGNFALQAAHLALDQPAAASAAVNVYYVASLPEVMAALGGRGYRAVQLEAGIRTGQVYLAATALGFRATGLTFYDDEVARFFGMAPGSTAVLMLAVFGR
jgi:SagB-type dehydrogenase family enzyme